MGMALLVLGGAGPESKNKNHQLIQAAFLKTQSTIWQEAQCGLRAMLV
jgi:hypothetical protein